MFTLNDSLKCIDESKQIVDDSIKWEVWNVIIMLLLYTTHVMHFANTLQDAHKLLSVVEKVCMEVNEVLMSPRWKLCLWIRLKLKMENETIIYIYIYIYIICMYVCIYVFKKTLRVHWHDANVTKIWKKRVFRSIGTINFLRFRFMWICSNTGSDKKYRMSQEGGGIDVAMTKKPRQDRR